MVSLQRLNPFINGGPVPGGSCDGPKTPASKSMTGTDSEEEEEYVPDDGSSSDETIDFNDPDDHKRTGSDGSKEESWYVCHK